MVHKPSSAPQLGKATPESEIKFSEKTVQPNVLTEVYEDAIELDNDEIYISSPVKTTKTAMSVFNSDDMVTAVSQSIVSPTQISDSNVTESSEMPVSTSESESVKIGIGGGDGRVNSNVTTYSNTSLLVALAYRAREDELNSPK